MAGNREIGHLSSGILKLENRTAANGLEISDFRCPMPDFTISSPNPNPGLRFTSLNSSAPAHAIVTYPESRSTTIGQRRLKDGQNASGRAARRAKTSEGATHSPYWISVGSKVITPS